MVGDWISNADQEPPRMIGGDTMVGRRHRRRVVCQMFTIPVATAIGSWRPAAYRSRL
jgi:hypothetical protein